MIDGLTQEQFADLLDRIDLNSPAPEKEPDRQYFFMKKGRALVDSLSAAKGRPLTACTVTFGCQMNARDSEKLKGILTCLGFKETEAEEADFVIYNTCTVRENANLRVYGRLGYLHNLKKKNPDMMIALCGCMTQEPEVVEKLRTSFSFVNLIFGTHNIYKFAELVVTAIESKRMVIDVWKDTDQIVERLPIERKYAFKEGVNITFGCDNFCSYCIVPYVRGRERSREADDIIREVQSLADDGVVEIMLLGQNVNSYGKTLKPPVSFADLLRRVSEVKGIRRVRFMTSHPKDFPDELLDVMKESKVICDHIHLPLQSGSSRILKAMNRHYDKEQYLSLVRRIRSKMPDISLTTDIIVGFPGETEEDFEETMDVVRQVRFDSAFTFLYSKRTGTAAAVMENQIPEKTAKERFDRLLTEVQTIGRETSSRHLGMVKDVLVESVNAQDTSLVTGRTANNIVTHFPGDSSLIGQIVSVKLTESKGFYYIGERTE